MQTYKALQSFYGVEGMIKAGTEFTPSSEARAHSLEASGRAYPVSKDQGDGGGAGMESKQGPAEQLEDKRGPVEGTQTKAQTRRQGRRRKTAGDSEEA